MFRQEVSSLQIVRQDIKVGNCTHFLTRKEVCHEKDIMDFIELPLEHKICFTVNNDYAKMATYVLKIKSPAKHKFIRASYEPFGRSKYINVNNLINIL